MRLVFATTLRSNNFSKEFTAGGARERLLSYWELREFPADTLETYVKTGVLPEPKKKIKRKLNFSGSSYLKLRRLALLKRIEHYRSTKDEED